MWKCLGMTKRYFLLPWVTGAQQASPSRAPTSEHGRPQLPPAHRRCPEDRAWWHLYSSPPPWTWRITEFGVEELHPRSTRLLLAVDYRSSWAPHEPFRDTWALQGNTNVVLMMQWCSRNRGSALLQTPNIVFTTHQVFKWSSSFCDHLTSVLLIHILPKKLPNVFS